MNLEQVFNPKSIAVVGASTKAGSVGNDILKNLVEQGYAGGIFPVNPKADELYGRKCYPSLESIGQPIDMMVIVIPAASVPAALRQGGSLGVKAAVIISAGFKEMGNTALEQEVVDICRENGMALIGPNCLGVINPNIAMNASFAVTMPKPGPVAFISQSGALCTAILDYADKLEIGFSKFASIGNKAVVGEAELFEYLKEDSATKVLAFYTEQLADAQRLIKLANEIAKGDQPKPIIALKSGKTAAGASASASHTGALAGNDSAYQALFEQAGIIRADSVSELFDYIQIFSNNALKPCRRAAVITNAGGPGVLTADALIEAGLELAKLSAATTGILADQLPAAANVHNPVDVLGDAKADRYRLAVERVMEDDGADCAVVVLTPQSTTEIMETATALVEAKNKYDKPLAVSFMGEGMVSAAVSHMRKNGIACFQFPEQAAKALAVMDRFHTSISDAESAGFDFQDVDRDRVKAILDAAKEAGKTSFPEAEALEIMSAYKFPLLKSAVARSADEANSLAQAIGTKLALKIFSQDILHKSDVGGIMLNVEPQDAGARYAEMMAIVSKNRPDAKLEGVVLMEMAPKEGLEMILGSSPDPSLGNMIMVGLGGIYVEVMKDVAFGLAPMTRTGIRKLLKKLKAYAMLEGVRGQKRLDIDKLVETIGRLNLLLTDFPEIKEIDINPLLVLGDGEGVRVLDSRIIIG